MNRRAQVALWVAVAAALLVGGCLAQVFLPHVFIPALFWPLYALLVVFAFCFPWRSVSLRLLLAAFLAGAGPVMLVTVGAERLLMLALERLPTLDCWLLTHLLPWGGDPGRGIVAPLAEESLKIAPLVLFLSWMRRRRWLTLGPLDIVLLAVAVGAGFDFSESAFLAFKGDQPLGDLAWATRAGPHLGPLYLFPSLTVQFWGASPMACFSHPGWTGTIGVALGLAWFLGRRHRWVGALPWLAVVWAMWDHYLWNCYTDPLDSPSALLRALPALDGYGWAMPFVMLAGIGYGAYLSARAVCRFLKADPAAAIGRPPGALIRMALTRPGELYAFLHARRALAYGARALKQTGFSDDRLGGQMLLLRAAVLDLRRGLTGEAVPAPAGAGARDG
ncbi:MAG: PrsW family intramembrane metalloprotease [Acetobacteraceae bacterium]|nr:PrsW family intramembrane metalloprotease [Acetobacteraceae bacterium]